MTFEPEYLVQTLKGRVYAIKKGRVVENNQGNRTRIILLKPLQNNNNDFSDQNLFFISKIHRPNIMQKDDNFAEGVMSWSHIKPGVSLEFMYTDVHSGEQKVYVTQPILYIYERK